MTKVAIKTWQVAMAGCFGILGDCRMKNGQASILHGAILRLLKWEGPDLSQKNANRLHAISNNCIWMILTPSAYTLQCEGLNVHIHTLANLLMIHLEVCQLSSQSLHNGWKVHAAALEVDSRLCTCSSAQIRCKCPTGSARLTCLR